MFESTLSFTKKKPRSNLAAMFFRLQCSLDFLCGVRALDTCEPHGSLQCPPASNWLDGFLLKMPILKKLKYSISIIRQPF